MFKKGIRFTDKVKIFLKEKEDRKHWRDQVRRYGDFRGTLTRQQLREAEEFWCKYTKHFSPLWHEFFTAKRGIFDVRYVPEDFQFLELEPKINIRESDYGIDDKSNYKMFFPEVRHPISVFRKMNNIYHADDYTIISEEQALADCEACGDVVLKIPKQSGCGKGIRFWKRKEGIDVLRKIIADMGQQINAQEYIQQHPDIARMSPNSCNTIRVMTYANEKGVSVICTYYQVAMDKEARMGQISAGGVCVSINSDGTLKPNGYDSKFYCYKKHSSGIVFAGYKIPGFQAVCDMACKLHQKMGDFRLISWDFTVGPDAEPIFIEMNLHAGGIMYHQLSNGPLYGNRTEEILNEIFER